MDCFCIGAIHILYLRLYLQTMKKLSVLLGLAVVASCTTPKKEVAEEGPIAFDVNYIDSTYDPCDDFYKYAIGNWQKNNPVPETESRWMAFNILYEANKEKLLAIIDEVTANTEAEKGSEEQMIRDLYNTGMDSVAREEAGIAALQPIFQEISEAERIEDIIHLFGELSPLGITNPVGISIGADKKNSTMNAVYAGQRGLNLPDRDYYLQDNEKFNEIRSKYVQHINAMFQLAGIEDFDGQTVLDLETKIAGISWSREERRDPIKTYNLMAFSDWDASLSTINMQQIASTRGFNAIDTIIVSTPSFFESLDAMMTEETVSDWKAYLTWCTLTNFANYLSADLEAENFAFYRTTLSGTKAMKPRNERIFSVVNGYLGEPLGKLFVKKHFDEESKQYTANMIENLRTAYRERINNLTWMSEETKQKANKKLEAFTYKVGYPDEWKDYSKLSISDESYIENIIAANKFNYNRMLEKQGQPVDKKEWYMTPQMVNAYYSASNNEIVFPAGILQPPFFHKDFDHAINYGGIGAVIGHEFSHGFDDQGSKYDWNGNLSDWWTEDDREKFNALAAKLGEQYEGYSPIEGMHVNGKLTMGENIADLGGVTMAYHALQLEYKDGEPEPIDGFDWKQRFFLGWANVWKGNITEDEIIRRLKSDSHSPARYRVKGPLVNFTPFYEAFGSCEGKDMYKPDSSRIVIW
jgi:putative endopeptidase